MAWVTKEEIKVLRVMCFCVFLLPLAVTAEEPSFGPIIEGYGPTYPIDDRDVALPAGQHYKAVFDLVDYQAGPDRLNRSLERVARYMNMHGRHGVAADAMTLAIVVHGSAIENLMNDTAYRSRHGIDNPNLPLLDRLSDAGVQVFVCGQSLAFRGVSKAELVGSAHVALSAMTMLTVLQSQGYALLP